MKRTVRSLAMGLAAFVVLGGSVFWYLRKPKGHPSQLSPTDPALARDWLYFYPSRAKHTASAIVFLFGNDVAFWEPHQDLAWRLAGAGYDVVGIDARRFLATLPANEPQRDSAFTAAAAALIEACRHTLGADSLPVILGGHSFGAEISFWIASRHPPRRLVGILALNTRSTGHLFITPADYLNREASGPWSFSTVEATHQIDPHVRIAIVRGEHDPFRRHDPEFLAAGGPRLRRFEIPFAGHALSTMLVAGPLIERAVRFLLDTSSVS